MTDRWHAGDDARGRDDDHVSTQNIANNRFRCNKTKRGSDQFVGTHHFVVFVLEVMAVPDVFAWLAVEARDDAGDHPGVAAHGVFPAGFVCGRWYRWPGELQFLARVPREE